MAPTLQLTGVRLRVSDLARSVEFYARRLGFAVARRTPALAELAAAPDAPVLLTLEEDREAEPAAPDAAGLFHAAVLFPSREALGGWLQYAAGHGIEFEGFSDHGVSEAIYLSDPDGNGLEFYADRPRDQWPYADGELAMTTRPLAVRSLLADARMNTSAPLTGTRWGHLHLRVTDLERSESFYRKRLGLDLMQRSFPGARFLAADGYHHHLGLNSWGGPRRPRSPSALGLVEATIARAGEAAEHSVPDPDGIQLRLQPLLVTA